MTTLTTPPLAPLLESLFAQAEAPPSAELMDALAQIPADQRVAMSTSTTQYREFYAIAKTAYMAVSRQTAQLLYMLTRSTQAHSIVEFGSSFGVSTLHLAAAVRDNGTGRIITTEFEPSKAARAAENFAAAGLADLIELREGDALQTLAHDLPDRIDLVVLDGAKGLYPAILALLEDRLAPGALIIADDAERSPDYLDHVRASTDRYTSLALGDDVELSMRLG